MELLLLILEGRVWLVDVTAVFADIYSWIRGKENRLERKQARAAGTPLPPRDRWNRRVIGLTTTIVITTAALIAWNS